MKTVESILEAPDGKVIGAQCLDGSIITLSHEDVCFRVDLATNAAALCKKYEVRLASNPVLDDEQVLHAAVSEPQV
jgi:hypothetical protein